MLKIAIVDDEFYFREYLKFCLPWRELGCEIVGEASNGEDGLLLLEEKAPDILLLDVNMPNLTGIAVSRLVWEKGLAVKIVILSGHNEFEYAQKAIQYGVKSYLLKPISEEELIDTIRQLAAEIESAQRHSAQVNTLEEQVWKNAPIVRENFLNAVLRGNIQKNAIPQTAVSVLKDLRKHYRGYLVFVFEIKENAGSHLCVEDKNLWQYAVRNIAQELISQQEKAWFCADAHDHIVCILAKEQLQTCFPSATRRLLEDVLLHVKKALSFSLAVGVGNATESVETVCISYEQALYALQNQPAGVGGIVEYEAAKMAISHAVFIHSETRKQLALALRTQDAAETQRILQTVFSQARSQLISYEMLHCHCIELLFCCMEYLSEVSVEYAEVFPESGSAFDVLHGVRTAEDALFTISAVYDRILCFMQETKSSRGKKQGEEIKNYVQMHYCEENFNVERIAAHFCVNYHHLCHSFKKQTGITLNHLIYEMRMERVKSLIQAGGRNITRLCDAVGYKDAGYFGKCFKKYTGVSLTEYINQTDT